MAKRNFFYITDDEKDLYIRGRESKGNAWKDIVSFMVEGEGDLKLP